MLGSLALFVVLVTLRRRLAVRTGVAFSAWAVWNGGQRLALDFTRGIDERPIAGLTGTQLLAVAVTALGLASLAAIAIRGRGWGERPGDLPSRQAPLTRTETG